MDTIRRSFGQAVAVSFALLIAIVAFAGGWLLGWILPGRR